LSLSGTTLSIQDGNSVNLAGIDTDTDDQTLSLSGTTLSIQDGNSVDLATLPGDNLGNHTSTQNLKLNGNWLSGDGGSEGIFINNSGNVGIGTNNPNAKMKVTTDATAGSALLLNYSGLNLLGSAPPAFKIDGSGYNAGGSVTGIEVDLSGATAGSMYAAIFNGGNVGIGTSTPIARLDVGGGNIALNGGWVSRDGGNEGVFVNASGDVGIGTASPLQKLSVAGSAYFTNNVGIGINAPINRLDVRENVTGVNNNANNYVAHFRNTNTDGTQEQGILHLQFDADLSGNPGNGNWIQFIENGLSKGKIENNNSGNVQYETNGADYAESLERLDHSEQIADGEVVGVYGGKISKRTDGADWVMAVSDNAAVLGNAIFDGTEANYESISFIGQIPVWVRGIVSKGDYIVASGLNDGMAIAVSPINITPEQGSRIVGRAWESKESTEVARVNTVVGLPEAASTTLALSRRVEAQQDEIATLKAQVAALQAQNNSLTSQNSTFEKRFAQLEAALQAMKSEVDNNVSTSRK
ncbi:MAG: hypothetical protein KDD14_20600, partial [Saprospiraceae bacterium]|nr:hypothetical protein [Saprospiraceae bacterium]